MMVSKMVSKKVPTIIFSLALFLLWKATSGSVNKYLLPSPGDVGNSFLVILDNGELFTHALATAYRVISGFLIATAVSVLLISSAFFFKPLAELVSDLATVTNSISVFVWITLSLIWFGVSNTSPIFVTTMIAGPILLSSLTEGLNHVSNQYLEMANLYQIKKASQFIHIVIPSLIPYFLSSTQSALGIALKVSVVAEMFGVTTGIGFAINHSRENLATDAVFTWSFVLLALMLLLQLFFLYPIKLVNKQWQS